MARAHFVTYALDIEGRPIAGVTVTVREPDTTTAIAETIYAEDDTAGNDTKTNPFTGESDGRVEIWLENPKIVDLLVAKTGYDDITIRAHCSQLEPTTFVLKDAGTPLTQRSGINFEDGFVLADDAANDETEIDLDYAGTAEIADVAAAEGAGSSSKVARGDHAHAHPSGLGTDLHHAKSHAHDGIDGSGTVAHEDLTGATANDHHTQSHAHDGADSSGTVSHDDLTELTTGDPHTQYVLESAHDLSAHDALLLATDAQVTSAVSTHDSDTDAHHAQAHPPADHPFKGAILTRAATQNIAGSTDTALVFNEADVYDSDAFHDPVTDNTKLVIPAAYDGHFVRLTFTGIWTGDTVGKRQVRIMLNGTTVVGGSTFSAEVISEVMDAHVCTRPIQVATGDYFEVEVRQTSGGNLTIDDMAVSLEVIGV